ncbi:hypothetical protein GSI_09230 [Ganoderma sinense ZZ0214-1]|uniref:Yeast cell wall synthesis Kre9/Knh1-like N-terminal domain-containing protein n=1 Tax=Ganoderma sinense ZZ0214-1 TaxID=1077348 RepID=A0A2G8S5Z2_9APHY|nr:hypothetical protein GSI_09230 [Ganoderma sinense ZZ0214-1]
MNAKMFSLLLLQTVFAFLVQATLYITAPLPATVCTGGKACTVEWVDDGVSPLLADIGACHVALYNGEEKLIQQLDPVDVSAQHGLQFTPDPKAGPDSSTYYINFTSVDPVDGATFHEFSTFFTITSMTGSFNSPVSSDASPVPLVLGFNQRYLAGILLVLIFICIVIIFLFLLFFVVAVGLVEWLRSQHFKLECEHKRQWIRQLVPLLHGLEQQQRKHVLRLRDLVQRPSDHARCSRALLARICGLDNDGPSGTEFLDLQHDREQPDLVGVPHIDHASLPLFSRRSRLWALDVISSFPPLSVPPHT